MGACEFYTCSSGKTPAEAFRGATENALYMYGHGGYTGTIAEKNCFVVISVPNGVDKREFAYKLMEDGDPRVDDKHGPAGCILLGPDKDDPKLNEYLFFGWASD